MTSRPPAGLSLAVFLAGAGATHLLAPRFYDAMIPKQLPGKPRTWTLASGAAEIVVAAAVAVPSTRPIGARAAFALFLAVFPANVEMAWDARRSTSTTWRVGTVARLPLQLPLLVWARRAERDVRR